MKKIIASVFALGLLVVGMSASAAPEVENEDPFLTQILSDYDS